MKRKYGFTLLEVIVTLAIIGALCAILIPVTVKYIEKARKTATIANAKALYEDVMNIMESDIVNDEESFKAIFTPQGSTWSFEATPAGTWTGNFKGNKNDAIAEWNRNQSNPNKKDNYWLRMLFRADGRPHETGSGSGDRYHATPPDRIFNTWDDADYNTRYHDYFIERLSKCQNLTPYVTNQGTFPLKLPYSGRDDGGAQPIVRWLITQRLDSKNNSIEIWAGDGTKAKNGPAYRVYPNPYEMYLS